MPFEAKSTTIALAESDADLRYLFTLEMRDFAGITGIVVATIPEVIELMTTQELRRISLAGFGGDFMKVIARANEIQFPKNEIYLFSNHLGLLRQGNQEGVRVRHKGTITVKDFIKELTTW